jgi:Cdc6-like AAA superfamily ATPase
METVASSVTFDRTQGKYVAMCDGIVVTKTKSIKRAQRLLKMHLAGLKQSRKEAEAEGLAFTVADRFSFVEQLTEMVARGTSPSAIVTGEGGIGKTFTITKVLKDNGFLSADDSASVHLPSNKVFVSVKGYSTPYALYRTLFENQDRVIIFDDCDSILSDAVAINLLKAALDSYSKRVVCWQSEVKGSDLPTSFIFNGGVIFISNKSLTALDQAVRSRALCVDLSMNADQKLERMGHLVEDKTFLPELSHKVKLDALNMIRDNLTKVRNLNLRTLIQVSKIRANADAKQWQKLALYVMNQ